MQNTEKHKYTQAEFDAFPVIDGVKQCPTGDYSEIKHFGENCSFGWWCSFGDDCSFGEWCSFGENCLFGKECSFAGCCSFHACCSFGEKCIFGEWCILEKGCTFGKGCVCEFGEFSQMCSFRKFGYQGCTTYAFALADGSIGIRCGYFTGNLDEFRAEVQKTYGDSKLAKEYLAIADLVSSRFGEV